MIYALDPQRGRGPIFENFHEWLGTEFPTVTLNIGALDKRKAFRKPKAHGASPEMDLESMPELCIHTMEALVDAARPSTAASTSTS
jgi:hypothetical protein